MKKNRLKFGIFIIIIFAIAAIVIVKFCLFNNLKDNPTFYEFVTSVIIAGVTAIYVLLTYEIVDTNSELLKESKKEREVLEKQLELLKRTLVIPNVKIFGIRTTNSSFESLTIEFINVSNLPAINLKVYWYIKEAYDKRNKYFISRIINYLKPGEKKSVEIRSEHKLKSESTESLPDEFPLLKDEVKKALEEYKENYTGTIILEYFDIFGEKNFVKSNIILSNISEYICTKPILIKEN